jgi:outer membrane receptor protein involved in Fe transport
MKCTPRAVRHGAAMPKPIALSMLVLGCFAAQPLFAQERPPEARPAAKTQAPPATPTQATQNPAKESPTTGAPDPQAGGPDSMATVEVVASRPTNKVDRDVYELKNDISVSNASAADILNNVPAVTVDADGSVALRGNQNVQIMVNGKRDAQFQGQNRGDALNAFPAEAIESIEVINVPGAEFGNEGGSGPIINLVLKRNRKPGSRANLSLNKGTEDRYRGFLNGEYAAGPYSISGNIGVSRNQNQRHSETQSEYLDPQTGNVTGGNDTSRDTSNDSKALNAAATLTYNVGERDQAGATFSYSKIQNETTATGATTRYGAGMTPTSDFSNVSGSRSPAENFGLGASYLHKSGEPGEELKFDLRYTGQNNDSERRQFYDYRLRPATYTTDNFSASDRRNRILDLSMDYQRVLWNTWQLKAGGKLAESKGENATNYLAVNPATGAYEPVASRISDFESNDRNAALYGILSTKLFSSLQVQGGIRGEYTQLKVRQPLLNQENRYYYTNWLPSFYATQDLSETATLQLRASRRIARPNERDLNPNLVYLGDFNARQGNPDLQPVNNDQAEIAYRDRFFTVDTSVSLFKRRESPVLGNRSYPLASDPNVIVTSPVNFGANDLTGVELNFNVRQLFIQGLSANFGATMGNAKRTRLSNFATGNVEMVQKNHQEDLKLRLAYQFATESLQLSVNRRGQSLNGQGTNGAMTMTSFTWRHRFTPRLGLNLNVSNVFHTGDMESFIENEVLRMHNLTTAPQRIITLGLNYQWGGVTGDERIRNGGRGMFRGQGGPGGRNGGDGGGDGGFGNGGGGGGFRNGGGGGF